MEVLDEQQKLEKRLIDLEVTIAELKKNMSEHIHNGYDSKLISQENLLPNTRSIGSITFSTDGRTYKIGLPVGCKNILFNGMASHYDSNTYGTGTRDARVMIVGNAHLGKGYNLQPDTTSSVVVGGLLQDIIQCSTNQTVVGSTLTTNISEYRIVSVVYPSAGVFPAQLNITSFQENYIEVEATLSPGWGIIGNFTAF